MLLRSRFLSMVALLAAFGAFSMAAMAQDDSKPADQGAVTQDKTQRRGFGKHGREGFRQGPGRMMGELRGITLTDGQKQQIHAIMESNKPDQASMDQMRTLMEAKRGGTLTAEQQEQLKAIKQQGRTRAESIHQQIQSILTPDQIAQIEKNKQERKQRFEERRQKWQERKTDPQPAPDKPVDN